MKAKKNKLIFWGLRGALIVALLLGLLWLFLWWRESPDYSGELAALLPADASAYVVVHELSATVSDFKKTQLYQQFTEEDDLLALVMSKKKYRKYQEEKGTVKAKLKYALTDRFIHRYFGRNAALAVVRFAEDVPPALLVIAQTRLGFNERVAEFCAELYPELKLETVDYQSEKIYLYRDEETKHSFSYFRYGKTVVLSLRSADLTPLKSLIDFRAAGSPNSLADSPLFQASMERVEQQRGAIAYLNPESLADDLRDLMGERFEKNMGKVKYRLLRRLLENHESANLSVSFDEQFSARLELHNPSRAATTDALAARTTTTLDLGAFAMVPLDTPLALAADSENLVQLVSEAPSWFIDDDERQWAANLLAGFVLSRLGSWELLKNIETLLGRDALLVVEQIRPGILFPSLRMTCVSHQQLGTEQEEALADMLDAKGDLAERAIMIDRNLRQWPLSSYRGIQLLVPFFVTQGEQRIFLSTDRNGHQLLLISEQFPSRALPDNQLFQNVWSPEREGDLLAFFANLGNLSGQLQNLRAQRILGRQLFSDAEDLAEFDQWLRIMPNMPALLLRAQNPGNSLRLELKVLVN